MLQTQPVETVVITVGLADRSYPIVIGDGILDDTQTLRHWLIPALANRRPVVVSQQPVIDHYIDAIKRAVPDSDVCLIADGEVHKTHATLDGIYAQLLRGHYGRDTVLVALGGGVIGDMTGFAAATYMRGVGFIQIPTTLLAQVDASVGGKTAINHPLGKNMIGAFYQPQLVCIDIATLATLPRREYISGLAEVIKYGCIADSDFWHWCIANAAALLARQPAALQHAIHRSCAIKAAVVADDERESGRRALLNFGHTFGHAIELLTNFSQYTHGEAVAIGMAMAARYAAARGDIPVTMADAVVDGIRRCELPVVPPRLDVDDCLGAMRRDKKAVSGEVRLVLLTAIGQARVVSDVDSNHLRQWLRTTLAH